MRALAIGIDRAAFGWLAVVPRDGPIALFPRGTAKTLPPGPHALLAPMSGHYNKLLWLLCADDSIAKRPGPKASSGRNQMEVLEGRAAVGSAITRNTAIGGTRCGRVR